MSKAKSLSELTLADDYDPKSLPVRKAREYINRFLAPIEDLEDVGILESLDRVIGEDIKSPLSVPPYDNSAMDGYAVISDDLASSEETKLKVVGKAFAGHPFEGILSHGCAVRIMTGAIIPQGANTVVMQENARSDSEHVYIKGYQAKGVNTRSAGEDLKVGEIALSKGKLVRPGDMGLLASLGVGQVRVYRKLKVACFSTGDELVPIGNQLGPGQIHDSNRYSLNGLLGRINCEIIDMGIIPDNKNAVEAALNEASQVADVIITTGGVSVGEADYIKEILSKLGEVLFWKIAMKPGRPLAYGKINSSHFFGLPGNPVSVVVTFYQFVQDALKKLQGQTKASLGFCQTVRCVSNIRKVPGRTEFQRGILLRKNNEWVVQTTGDQGSGILSSISQADCFIILDSEDGNIDSGEMVQVQTLEGMA